MSDTDRKISGAAAVMAAGVFMATLYMTALTVALVFSGAPSIAIIATFVPTALLIVATINIIRTVRR